MTPHPPDPLAVRPFTLPVSGAVGLPGSKSLTNRALLLSALCEGPVTLTGALFSEDTETMAEALRRLGFSVDGDEASREFRVGGRGGEVPAAEADLFAGLSGTAARFLTALCASSGRGVYRIDGAAQMRQRPMKGLIDALRSQGADIRCLGAEGYLPVEVRACGLLGGPVRVDARESSQMLSALLMVAPLAREPLVAAPDAGVRMAFVRMTLRQMAQFGVGNPGSEGADGAIRVDPASYRSPTTYAVEPDATAASYFAALPLVAGGSLRINGLKQEGDSLQGDVRFLDILARCGAAVSSGGGGTTVSLAEAPRPRGITQDFSGFSDTFLTLAAVAPLLDGPTRILGIGHTRRQETDRVSGMAGELRRLGQEVAETEDSLEIRPGPLRRGLTVGTHGDHRFAMSFAVLGCRDLRGDGKPWLSIADPACCAKTFPGFFDLLDEVRGKTSGS
ncbi:MAG TPA: 3-phosphoshikimate 1-carboxyvinyltransferase [Opitutaceae bacterium]|nr:3-phosphoshikimate 1-carboxyvinyltransferase [Opitutaceae bacterium]